MRVTDRQTDGQTRHTHHNIFATLTWFVLDGGHVLRHQLSLEQSVVLVLGQPAAVRKDPLLAERRAVDLDVLQVPRPAAARVVVTDPAIKHSKFRSRSGA